MNGRYRALPLAAFMLFPILVSGCPELETTSQGSGEWVTDDGSKTNDGASGVTVYEPAECENGYTLLTAMGGYLTESGIYCGTVLIDMDGSIVNEWQMAGFPAKVLPGGFVLGGDFARLDASGHQELCRLIQLDWDGNEVWSFDDWGHDDFGTPIARMHHDFQREGNPVGYPAPDMEPLTQSGNTLILGHENVDRPDISRWLLEDDAIYEVDWEGHIVWRWLASDHFDEFGFRWYEKAAIMNVQISPAGNPGEESDYDDWLHINSISYLGPNPCYDSGDDRFHPENVIFTSRSSNISAIIEKATGDIVWKIGPDFWHPHRMRKLGQMVGPHHVHMIPRGLPGEGNILVFDNGGASGYGLFLIFPLWPNRFRLHSRVVEFDPVTLDIVWEYMRLLPRAGETHRFFSWLISSAQRLSNGNTLITEGVTGRVFEVTPSQKLVWEYISPFDDYGGGNEVYRAYRIPYEYILSE